VGVGSKSVDLFDAVLRELLRFYLELASVKYDERLKKVVGSKSIDELTMGQVIVCLRTLDTEITRACCIYSDTILSPVLLWVSAYRIEFASKTFEFLNGTGVRCALFKDLKYQIRIPCRVISKQNIIISITLTAA